jgi:tRNA-uridine 2-sulfurtransferase
MKQKTIVIGLSGGVDSSVAALILKQKGYKVIGAFMKNFSDTKNPLTKECNWIAEKRSAQKICSLLKINLVTFDFEKEYKSQVINPMFSSYARGLTPNPDISCNNLIKFPLFWKKAKALGADLIAMGHYAKIKKTDSSYQLLQGQDSSKDQSYFLYRLKPSDLKHTLFPIGNLTKTEIRRIAKKNKFPNWDKPGTTGICFVGPVNLKSFLSKKIKPLSGKILSPEGKLLGQHPGVFYYTIGQRLGPRLGFDIKKPKSNEPKKWYVANKKGNILIVAPKGHPTLKKSLAILKKFHIINKKDPIPKKIKARIRHLGPLISGKLSKRKFKYQFKFSKPQKEVAPGQSLVLYHKNQVVGGGEIEKTE